MLLIIDLDDTILNTHRVAFERNNLALSAMGCPETSFEEFLSFFGNVSFPDCLIPWLRNNSVEEFYRVYEQEKHAFPYQTIVDLSECLRVLRNRFESISLLTNTSQERFEMKVKESQLDLSQFTSIRTEAHKPSPIGILDLLERERYKADNVVYIGDDTCDYEAAKTAGVNFIAVLSGTTPKSEFVRAGLAESKIFCDLEEFAFTNESG